MLRAIDVAFYNFIGTNFMNLLSDTQGPTKFGYIIQQLHAQHCNCMT